MGPGFRLPNASYCCSRTSAGESLASTVKKQNLSLLLALHQSFTHQLPLLLTDFFIEQRGIVWQWLTYCISEKAAAQRVLAVVLSCACFHHCRMTFLMIRPSLQAPFRKQGRWTHLLFSTPNSSFQLFILP